MENWLVNATKKRIIWEVQKILYDHPRYRGDSKNVYNKYSFDSREQRGVIVNSASADRVRLAADNYMGCLSSFVMMAPVGNCPMTSIEWVKENPQLLERYSPTRSVFPSPPGVYVVTVTKLPDDGLNKPGEFVIDPVLTVRNERLITFTSSAHSEAQLMRTGIYPGSARLWLDGRRPLVQGIDFRVDHESGLVTFLRETPTGSAVYADYRYSMPSQGPFAMHRESTNESAIPGAVLAFGDRIQLGDRIAIVVTEDRSEVAEVYGGKFEVNFELLVFSRDSEDREKLSDYLVIKLLERQNQLGYEGLELIDVAPGAESEEVYNAETDEHFYEVPVSLSMRVDWTIHKPLPVEVFRAETTTKDSESQTGYLDGTATSDGVRVASSPLELLGIAVSVGKGLGYERVI